MGEYQQKIFSINNYPYIKYLDILCKQKERVWKSIAKLHGPVSTKMQLNANRSLYIKLKEV